MIKAIALSLFGFAASLSCCTSFAAAQATLPSDFAVQKPTIPDHHFNISDFGAVGDGKTSNTDAISKAIAACTLAGGGTVEVPAGTFLTGPFKLASSLNFHLAADAIIRFSDKREEFQRSGDGFENCITAPDCHDLEITGSGTIDGSGRSWWIEFRLFELWKNLIPYENLLPPYAPPHRPYLMTIANCNRLLVKGVTLTNSPMLTFIPRLCKEVTIDSVHIQSPADSPNTDGLDPSGFDVLIQNCIIDTGDDNIALKPRPIPDPKHLSCENFLIQNCVFKHGHGMSIGGGSNGGVRNMVVRNCQFEGTNAGIRLKSGRDRGGLVEDLTYENLTMKDVKTAIQIVSYYPDIPAAPQDDPAKPVAKKTPIWRHIRINNVISDGGTTTAQIIGLPEMPIDDVVLTKVKLNGQNPPQIINANGVKFVDCLITAKSGEAAKIINSKVDGLMATP